MKKSSFVAMILSTGYVHGADSRVERIPAGSYYGSDRCGCSPDHGACVEKDGK